MGGLRRRAGLGVASDAVRAVIVRGTAIVWSAESPRQDGEALGDTIHRVLASAPLPRWPRLRMSVAVGPSLAQTKHLTGLPPVSHAPIVARLVAEGSSRFFLRNGVPIVTTGVRVTGPGEGWAAAVEEPMVDELVTACRRCGIALRAIVPTVVVLPIALDGQDMTWVDGPVRAELSYENRVLRSARRMERSPGGEPPAVRSGRGLTTLGGEGWRFADAYGAAMLSRREPLVLRAAGWTSGRATTQRWRLRLAAGLLVVALVGALLSPGLAATVSAHRARQRLSGIAAERWAATLLESELMTTTAALAELSTFAQSRRSFTLLLAELTRALPRESAVVALRADSSGGSMVALAVRAGAVLGAMESIGGITSPEIFGPVTKEIVGGSERERVTIRFRFPNSYRRGEHAATGARR